MAVFLLAPLYSQANKSSILLCIVDVLLVKTKWVKNMKMDEALNEVWTSIWNNQEHTGTTLIPV